MKKTLFILILFLLLTTSIQSQESLYKELDNKIESCLLDFNCKKKNDIYTFAFKEGINLSDYFDYIMSKPSSFSDTIQDGQILGKDLNISNIFKLLYDSQCVDTEIICRLTINFSKNSIEKYKLNEFNESRNLIKSGVLSFLSENQYEIYKVLRKFDKQSVFIFWLLVHHNYFRYTKIETPTPIINEIYLKENFPYVYQCMVDAIDYWNNNKLK